MTKADVEKARQNKEQKRNMAEDAKNEYAQKLVKCNEQQKNHHTQLIPGMHVKIRVAILTKRIFSNIEQLSNKLCKNC